MEDGNSRREVTYTGGARDEMLISNIMQRFRPIAPKPVPSCSFKYEEIAGTKSFMGRKKRMKRKYVRVRKNNKDNTNGGNCSTLHKNIVTLQLLPEKDILGSGETVLGFTGSDSKIVTGDDCMDLLGANNQEPLAGLTTLSKDDKLIVGLMSSDPTAVESWVTVECVTGTCTDELVMGDQLGRADIERVRHLEVDTCPGFVSDELNRVRWVNMAYRRMMGVRVCLMAKVGLRSCMAVTCRVRIEYDSTWRKEGNRPAVVKMTVPSDVWRMGFGWLAWRLDVQAGLSLGR